MEETIKKAMELGELVAGSELALRLEAARAAFDEDMEARETLFAYNEARRNFEEMTDGSADPESFKAAREALREARVRLEGDKIINELVTCESRFDNYVKQVLNIVKRFATGEEDCGGNCAGCNGCASQ